MQGSLRDVSDDDAASVISRSDSDKSLLEILLDDDFTDAQLPPTA